MPTKEELSQEWRGSDTDKHATVAADFNGDGLVDGCFLVVDKKHRKLVVMVVLFNNDNSESWIKLKTMDYDALKYQGVTLIKPSIVNVYKGNTTEDSKHQKTLKYNSIKLFSSGFSFCK